MYTIETNLSVTPGVIRVAGEVTIYHAVEIYQDLRPLVEAGSDLEVDMSGVSEIDTAGIQVLLVCKRLATQGNSGLRIVNHSRAVIEILDGMNLASRFGDPIVIAAAH